MKKIYAFLAAALMSISVFAAPETVPTKSNLTDAGYNPDANVVLCMYFDVLCNPVILVGNYHGKESPDNWNLDSEKNLIFKELTGYEGWFVVEFPWTDEYDLYAKPIQLKDDKASWDFQSGDPKAWVPMDGSDIAEINLENGNESSVKYPAAGAYIYELKYWKAEKSPCVVIPKCNYTIYLFDPQCEGSDFKPAIIGDFSGWSNVPMSETTFEGDLAYMYKFTDEADHKIKFREVTDTDWSNQIQKKNAGGGWENLPDYFLPAVHEGTDTTLIFEYWDTDTFKYTLCGMTFYAVAITAMLPEGAPAAGVEVVGNFKDGSWDAGVAMTFDEEAGAYTATISAVESSEFKIRELGTWSNQLMYNNGTEWVYPENWKVGEEWEDRDDAAHTAAINLDLVEDYKWEHPAPQGIENIKLTEDAHKVVVDGVLYIVRDNKLFNVQGAQVR